MIVTLKFRDRFHDERNYDFDSWVNARAAENALLALDGTLETTLVEAFTCGGCHVPDYMVQFIRSAYSGADGKLAVSSIKFLRSYFTCGLKDAKDAYDSIIADLRK